MKKIILWRARFSVVIAVAVIAAGIFLLPPVSLAESEAAELAQTEAIARVRTILQNNTRGCRINKINSISVVRMRSGWRVTARIVMSASGRRRAEKAVWIIGSRAFAVAQDQLTAEIGMGCP